MYLFIVYKEQQLVTMVTAMQAQGGVAVKDKRYFLKAYAKCFTGTFLFFKSSIIHNSLFFAPLNLRGFAELL